MYYKEFQHFFRSGFITALFLIFGYSMNAQEAGRQATPDKPVYRDIVVHRPPQREVPPVKALPLPAPRRTEEESLLVAKPVADIPSIPSVSEPLKPTGSEAEKSQQENGMIAPSAREADPEDRDIVKPLKNKENLPVKMKISREEFGKISPEKQQYIREHASEFEIVE